MDRSRKTSLTDQMAERFRQSEQFVLTITPEGTRKANPEWKKGFYYIARGAKVPVLLMAFDFPTRTVNITKELLPSDDVEADIMVMKQLYHRHDNWNERIVKPVMRLIRKNADIIRLSDLGFPENWAELIAFAPEKD